MDVRKLEETAHELVAPGKGILAADESFGTIGKRFEALGIDSSEESRRAYREMLFEGAAMPVMASSEPMEMSGASVAEPVCR